MFSRINAKAEKDFIMRLSTLFLGFIISSGVSLAQQTTSVTPQSLAGWSVIGADRQVLAEKKQLALPAGVQIARSFNTGSLVIQVTTIPVIGLDSHEWPVIEIGAAALVFARHESNGKLLLILDDRPALDLSLDFALDSGGQAVSPITLIFAHKDSLVSVKSGEEVIQVDAGPTQFNAAEVVVSSGNTEAWSFQSLSVTSGFETARVSTKQEGQPVSLSSTSTAKDRVGSTVAVRDTRNFVNWSDEADAIDMRKIAVASPKKAAGLEVSSPPAVRTGRAASVRATASQGIK